MRSMTARKTADLPLHSGSAPAWLFRRMVELAGAIGTLIVRDQGPVELLRRLSDPFWFQAFGCVLGFDWHSSGVTTTVCGALKEAAKRCGDALGVVVCGGKGATSRKTPDEIRRACERTSDAAETLVHASKMSAKVDNAAVQDGYQLYHHAFFFVPGQSAWCVVQQGMNDATRYARRYHWLSERLAEKGTGPFTDPGLLSPFRPASLASFVSEPHAAVACAQRRPILNLVAGETDKHRDAVTTLSREHPERILREVRPLLREPELPLFAGLSCADDAPTDARAAAEQVDLRLPARHTLTVRDLQPESLRKV